MSRFEIKIVAALLLIAIIPLVASVLLVGQVIRVSDGVAEGQTRRLVGPLEDSADAYRRLFETLKTSFKLRAELLSMDQQLLAALVEEDRKALEHRLDQLLGVTTALGRVEVREASGRLVARAVKKKILDSTEYRDLELDRPLGTRGHVMRVIFFTPRQPFDNFSKLDRARRTALQMTFLRDELSTYYTTVFLIIFGAVLLLTTIIGVIIARRTTRRVAVLASATRKVAEGDLQTQVQLTSKDELGDLAEAFNEMVSQIRESRERITYLEKIGAWQEIARRLAHEIKNPLTPIQLAVQQVHRKYQGDDEKFARMLDDARDIVTEEVAGLRRLVQAFSAFAKLPTVQPEAVDINALVDDFLKSRSEIQKIAGLQWTSADPSVEVQVDRMLIKNVLFNLVENAVHAAEESGDPEDLRVTLSTRLERSRDRLALMVEDNGPGMPAEVAAHVFDPYFTTKEKGTGLGLAIVKKIILEHNGSIAVESEPGEGAKFTIMLPLASGEQRVKKQQTKRPL